MGGGGSDGLLSTGTALAEGGQGSESPLLVRCLPL